MSTMLCLTTKALICLCMKALVTASATVKFAACLVMMDTDYVCGSASK